MADNRDDGAVAASLRMMATCHPLKPMKARKMCNNCYDKWLKMNNSKYKSNQRKNHDEWMIRNPSKLREYHNSHNTKLKRDPIKGLRAKRRHRDRELLRKYGITIEQYEDMLEQQGGECFLCDSKPKDKTFHVDHSHKTGKVRGILCGPCNWYLGKIDRDETFVKRLITYLKG